MPYNGKQADFGIEIGFDKQSESPSRVFKTMSELIDAFQDIDQSLIGAVDPAIKPILLLEDIEAGSLRSWFINKLKETDDEALKDLNWKRIVGSYLVKAKYTLVDFLDKKTEIKDASEIKALENDIFQLATETDVRKFPAYAPVPRGKLLDGIKGITGALSHLKDSDRAKYLTPEKNASFNLEFHFVPEDIEELITKNVIESTVEMIMKVKKPDYLGESMWELRYDNRIVLAKLFDEEWLARFQRREIDVRPGDALRAMVKTTVNYGYDDEVVSSKFSIMQVLDVIRSDDPSQQDLLLE